MEHYSAAETRGHLVEKQDEGSGTVGVVKACSDLNWRSSGVSINILTSTLSPD